MEEESGGYGNSILQTFKTDKEKIGRKVVSFPVFIGHNPGPCPVQYKPVPDGTNNAV